MPARPSLHSFIDEELLRAPMTIDIVIDAVLAQWRMRPPPANRLDGDPVRVLLRQRTEVVSAALGRLREGAQAEVQQLMGGAEPTRCAAMPRETELALIGEDEVAVDVEIARCIQSARLRADVELRSLQTYTSALVDDRNVARDTNPFRPDRFVRALWAGVQTLPLSRPVMAAFLHDAAEPLAESLKNAYRGAWQRLAEQGVTPAVHRTIIAGGGGWGDTSARYRPPEGLDSLRGSLPSVMGALAPSPRLTTAPASRTDPIAPRHANDLPATPGAAPAATQPAAEPELMDLVDRLFATLQRDFGLLPEASALLQQLQPVALRLARHDPSLLDSYEHPLWRFMDQVVHDIQTSAPAQRIRLAGLARNLVEHLSGSGAGQIGDFGWALDRVRAAQRHALAQATAAAGPAIQRLQRQLRADAPATTSTMPLDIGSLDTVPAALMTEPAAARPATALLSAGGLQPGLQLRIYLKGEWRTLVALWQDDDHELALLRDPAADRLWALRQAALARLLAEGLAQPMRVRSLVRRAADRVLRGP